MTRVISVGAKKSWLKLNSLFRTFVSRVLTATAIIGVMLFGARAMTATAEASGWQFLNGLKPQGDEPYSLVGRRGRWRGRGWRGRRGRWWRGRRGRWWRGRRGRWWRGRRGWWWGGPVIIIRP